MENNDPIRMRNWLDKGMLSIIYVHQLVNFACLTNQFFRYYVDLGRIIGEYCSSVFSLPLYHPGPP